MGAKLCWTGLTIYVLSSAWPIVPAGDVIGAIIMALGVVIMWLENKPAS